MSPRSRYLATTAALVAVAASWVLVDGWGTRPGARLERDSSGAVSRPTGPPPAAPSAREILAHRSDLSLTEEQTARLEALDRRWRQESDGLTGRVRAAQQEFARYLETRAGRGARLQDLQERSEEFRALSAELRELRRGHGESAIGTLEDWQRTRLIGSGRVAAGGGRR